MQFVRPAGIEDDIVEFTPVVMPSGLQVMTTDGNGTTDTHDVMNVLQNIHMDASIYFVICWYFATAFLAFALVRRTRSLVLVKLKRWLAQWYEQTFHFAVTMVDQEYLSPTPWSVRFAWLSCCVAIFVAIAGYLLNFIQTDGIVEQPGRRLERFHDLLDDKYYQEFQLSVITGFTFYSYFVTAAEGTAAYRLYSRMKKTDNCSYSATLTDCSFVRVRTADPSDALEVVKYISTHAYKRGLLINKSYVEAVLRPSACMFLSDVLSKSRASNDFLVADYMTGFYSKNIDRNLLKYLNHRITSMVAGGLTTPTLKVFVNVLDEEMPTEELHPWNQR
ncbi:hypothetical protein HDE_06987 [Halotydeus destructor]|nr:hypothetical protein HDE_06987 [Halotydeus destructor]